jgi:hypothetical protein
MKEDFKGGNIEFGIGVAKQLQKAIKIICPLPLKDKKKTKKTRQRDYST